MTPWQLHWIEAEGSLEPWRAAILAELSAAHAAFSAILPPTPLDVLVWRWKGRGIPTYGIGGETWPATAVRLHLDPEDADFARAMEDGVLRRIMVHELHHTRRMATPAWDRTLRARMVDEGLADHFILEALGGAPMRWSEPLPPEERAAVLRRAAPLLDRTDFPYRAWMFGWPPTNLPRWTGYRLGFDVVGRFLARHPAERPSTLIATPARDIWDGAGPLE